MRTARKYSSDEEVILRRLGCLEYAPTLSAMQEFTRERTSQTRDEIWLLEHPPVFTMGLKGRNGTVSSIHGIPVVYTDRGGDMSYHGPGQIVVYLLIDLQRRGWGPKHLVTAMEQAVIELLASEQILAVRREGAPGVYVSEAKVASLGLRIRHGASYHGLALNVDMDLEPFSFIAPCGYPGQPVTQLLDLGIRRDINRVSHDLSKHLMAQLGYTAKIEPSD